MSKVSENMGEDPLCNPPEVVPVEAFDASPCTADKGFLRKAAEVRAAEPLWQRVPKTDRQGRLLSDFMMLIPGLKRRTDCEIRVRLHAIYMVLRRYGDAVVFVELNMRLNTLWVSVEARPGLCLDIPLAIQAVVPEALLVGQRAER